MKNTRRTFLKSASGIAAAGAAFATPNMVLAAAEDKPAASGGGALTDHKLPDLPYPYDALEPYINTETMKLHHDKHHAAYVTNLIKAEKALADARAANDFAMVQHWSRAAAFNGGGHALHSLFWTIMAPAGKGGGGEPTGQLADKIKQDFGSFAAFKAQFSAAAKAVEGSGWALLHHRVTDHRLIVLQAENQQKLGTWDSIPILGIDVWEHAYYLTYRNDRAKYVDEWWNIVNWEHVAKNLAAHTPR
ncbi:MAG: superoxide dismutase [Candidatus Hydrogenedentes bacterium]|nr:superoxide dismutase [Candidatus Hydrogenedentota bacterium]